MTGERLTIPQTRTILEEKGRMVVARLSLMPQPSLFHIELRDPVVEQQAIDWEARNQELIFVADALAAIRPDATKPLHERWVEYADRLVGTPQHQVLLQRDPTHISDMHAAMTSRISPVVALATLGQLDHAKSVALGQTSLH